ncbi:hypothetical protein PSHT_13943 [Puccinia striiformis]|uniref:Uncharacterized protein n=1 Tax=Puccinia striiformis TaxID=27350 RepID=A0A2S4UNG4_9BASI|nr:hypothetical protein PSHT_13943 [Puccinia striiformis]
MNLNSQQNDTSTLSPFVERTRSQTNVARTQTRDEHPSLSMGWISLDVLLVKTLQSDEPGKRYSKLINPHLQNK